MTPPGPPPRQTPAEPASGVLFDQVPAAEEGSDLAAGGQDGARSVPEPPPPPPPPGPDRFSRGFPNWPPPPRPRLPPNVTLREGQRSSTSGFHRPRRPSRLTHPPLERRLWTWIVNLLRRRAAEPASRVAGDQVPAPDPTPSSPAGAEDAILETARAILAGELPDQVVAIDPTGKLPSHLGALEVVAGAARRYLEGPAHPKNEEQQIEDLARMLNLAAAVQLLDAVEARDRGEILEALASQP